MLRTHEVDSREWKPTAPALGSGLDKQAYKARYEGEKVEGLVYKVQHNATITHRATQTEEEVVMQDALLHYASTAGMHCRAARKMLSHMAFIVGHGIDENGREFTLQERVKLSQEIYEEKEEFPPDLWGGPFHALMTLPDMGGNNYGYRNGNFDEPVILDWGLCHDVKDLLYVGYCLLGIDRHEARELAESPH
jgi:hypothetical protein